jgi:Putative peptidoglycan binding domain
MELTTNKIAAGVVGLAMVAGLAFAFTATRAHAVSLSELVELFIALEVISPDKADEARAVLEGQDEEETTTPAVSMTCNFTRNLKTGDTGADVKDLQKLLNAKGYTVAATGAGSAGMETEYFGPATAAAVAKMQEAYAADILTPLGLTTGTGFFGASTRAKANTLCSATPEVPTTPDDEDEDEDEDKDSGELSGEASLKTTELDSADDDEINEGSEEAPIAEATLEFSDGDALITRMDIELVGTGDETDPWDTFETIGLMVDDEVVAEMDATDEDEYLDEDDGTVRFSGLDIVAMEDEEVVVTVFATVQNSVDGTDNGEAWTVDVLNVRFVDGDDVTSTEDFTATAVGFSIEEAGDEDEIIVKTSSSDLDASTIKVEDDSKSDWVTVFVFDLDTDDSENDISIDLLPVSVTVGTGTYADLVDDAQLVIDGTTIDSTSADVTDGATAVIDFDVDGDVVVEAGERVKAELQLRFKALEPGNEGATVQGKVTSTNSGNIDAEGADDINGSGSANGDEHQLLTAGIFAEIVSTDVDTKNGPGGDDTLGEFIIKFDVTAFEDDYYLSATNTAAYDVSILQAGTASSTAVKSIAISSTAAKNNNAYLIADGDTETVTLTITFEPGFAANYSALLNSVDFGDLESAPLNQTAHEASPAEDFETDPVFINA